LGSTPFSEGLSRSTAAMVSSTRVPMVGCLAWALRCDQRASGGTQKMPSARYSSGSSGSAPSVIRVSSSAWYSSKASEMYFRKIRPRTTCLYSAASIAPRRASAVFHSSTSRRPEATAPFPFVLGALSSARMPSRGSWLALNRVPSGWTRLEVPGRTYASTTCRATWYPTAFTSKPSPSL
jgi:hypothetical protein